MNYVQSAAAASGTVPTDASVHGTVPTLDTPTLYNLVPISPGRLL